MLKRRRLRSLLSYDRKTGIVTTKCKMTLQAVGYMRIEIKDVTYRLSDVVYILVNGSIPPYTKVIHLNDNKLDFRLDNLYLDTTGVDKHNIKVAKKTAKDAEQSLNARRVDMTKIDSFFNK